VSMWAFAKSLPDVSTVSAFVTALVMVVALANLDLVMQK